MLGFDAVWLGSFWLGRARFGPVRQARLGRVRFVGIWCGLFWQVGSGEEWLNRVRLGLAGSAGKGGVW